MLPGGCIPQKTCKKAQFAMTQRTPIEFHNAIGEALVLHCGVSKLACLVYDDRVTLRDPIEINKIINALEPLVRTPRRRAQIQAFQKFYAARMHLFRPHAPKPRLRKDLAG
ncbi:MAG: hypothetical protein JRM80_04825 [Nitrososphaerota archaeon]|nr:hypothetical protein [Nitrososphaerota archaeon]